MVLGLVIFVVGLVVVGKYVHNKAHDVTNTSHEMIGFRDGKIQC